MGVGVSINKDQEHIQKHRGSEGHGIFGDCQKLRHGCSVDACWGVMGIEATSLVVRGGEERDTHSMLRQVDFIKSVLEVLKAKDENTKLALKVLNSGRSKAGMRYHLCCLGHNSLRVKIALHNSHKT